jgi:hypothetical protein
MNPDTETFPAYEVGDLVLGPYHTPGEVIEVVEPDDHYVVLFQDRGRCKVHASHLSPRADG